MRPSKRDEDILSSYLDIARQLGYHVRMCEDDPNYRRSVLYPCGITFACMDCHRDTSPNGLSEYYMIQFDLWDQTTNLKERDWMLCIGCLEKRLGRKLVPRDFTDCPLNRETSSKSKRLCARIGNRFSMEGDPAITQVS